VAAQTLDVPAIEPGDNHPFQTESDGREDRSLEVQVEVTWEAASKARPGAGETQQISA
jgi:hypothetical protein